MEHRAGKAPAAEDRGPGEPNARPPSDPEMPPRLHLLETPGRYADDIQGELVRLREANRRQGGLDPFNAHLQFSAAGSSAHAEDGPCSADSYGSPVGLGFGSGSFHSHDPSAPTSTVPKAAEEQKPLLPLPRYMPDPHPPPMYLPHHWPAFGSGHSYGYTNGLPSYDHPMTIQHMEPAPTPQPYHLPDLSTQRNATFPAPGSYVRDHTSTAGQSPLVRSQTPVDAEAMHGVDVRPQTASIARRPSASSMSLSEGELEEPDGAQSDHGYLSEGEVFVHTARAASPRPAAPSTPAPAESQESVEDGVIRTVKARIADMLRLKDPRLLKSPQLRALMLLLKCIQLGSAEAVNAQVRSAPLGTASELRLLAQEFGLDTISSACTGLIPTAPASGSESEDVDMDTQSSSDEDDPQPNAGTAPATPRPMLPLEMLPATPPRLMQFSRSRAPSPPSAHPRQSRVFSAERRTSLLCDSGDISGHADKTVESPLALEAADSQPNESTVCTHEGGSLVVFVEEDSSSSESEPEPELEESGDIVADPALRPRSLPNTPSDAEIRIDGTAVAPPQSKHALLKTKQDIKAHEMAMARLKLQISQKRAVARRQKKILDQGVVDSSTSTGENSILNSPKPPTPPELPPSSAATPPVSDQPVAASDSRAGRVVPPSSREASDSRPLPAVDLPTKDALRRTARCAPADLRQSHLMTVAAYLDEAAISKQAAVDMMLAEGGSSSRQSASEQLAAKLPHTEAARDTLQDRICRLEAELELARSEMQTLDYSMQAHRGLQTVVDAKEQHSSIDADALADDIQKIVSLKELVADLAEQGSTKSEQSSAKNEQGSTKSEQSSAKSEQGSPQDKPAEASSTDESKSAVGQLRARLVAMQNEQRARSQRLTNLAEKRKQQAPPTPALPTPAKKPKPEPPANTDSVSWTTVLTWINDALQHHLGPYEKQCADALQVIDSCILQSLTIVDEVGTPTVVFPPVGLATKPCTEERTSERGSATPVSVSSPASTTKQAPTADGATVESLLGDIATVSTSGADPTADRTVLDADSADWSQLKQEHLKAAIREAPIGNAAVVKQYYRRLRDALESCGRSAASGEVPMLAVARALLPIWHQYRSQLAMAEIKPANPLYAALGFSSENPATKLSPSLAASKDITKKEQWYLRRLLESTEPFLPVLNIDIATVPKVAERKDGHGAPGSAGSAARYFAAESKPTDSKNQNNPNALYDEALRAFWKGIPTFNRPILVNDVKAHLTSRANKGLGEVVLMLKRGLQKWPATECLWDLYLELYTRQRAPADDVLAAFSDATKRMPYSTCIWRRYVIWCGWNAQHCKKTAAPSSPSMPAKSSWLVQLSMATSMAIRCLAGCLEKSSALRISATIAELLIHLWDCVGEEAAQPHGNTHIQPRMLAHMHACLTAVSLDTLCSTVSEACATESSASMDTMGSTWDLSGGVLASLLLPHHLLLVSQVFAYSFIADSRIPRLVNVRLYGALHAAADYQAVYYVDMDRVAACSPSADSSTPTIKPFVSSVVSKLYDGILRILDGPKGAVNTRKYGKVLLSKSKALCRASVNATIAQLRLYCPDALPERVIDCEEMFWHTRNFARSGIDIQRLPEMMGDWGVTKFLLVTMALSTGGVPGTEAEAIQGLSVLWQHAAHIVKLEKLGFVSCDRDARLDQRISNTRDVYYTLVGYSGTSMPTSVDSLVSELTRGGNRKKSSPDFYEMIRANAGTWTNLALIELFSIHCAARDDASVKKAVDSAILWLECGLQYIDAQRRGSRAQIWACLLRLIMTQRALSIEDMRDMHDNLSQAGPAHVLQSKPQSHALVNFAIQTVLGGNPSPASLDTIARYLGTMARSNAELAIRVCNYAWKHEVYSLNMRNIVRQMSYLENPKN